MRVAALQSDVVWEDPEANFARLERWIALAAEAGARLLALPEMFACGFSMAAERVAEPEDGPSSRFLVEQARRHRLWLAGSLPEHAAGAARPANALLLAGPGGERHRYRKIHPFTYAGEDRAYQAGDEHVTVDVEGLRLTLFICYDLRFADEFWVTAPGTDAYLVVANWPEPRREHWTALLRARAIENQAYVVGVNRVGEGGGLRYAGDSRIIDPMGRVLAAGAEQETLLLADLDPAEVAKVRRELPFLADRR
ncbi:MAG: carbon-nitrogen family hydrolase [Acidobacteria bacterium]|nr:MAG: carbon-nitrogen family hydrolase [Acidobacteriota bacterium]